MVLKDLIKIELNNPNVKIASGEEYYVWSILNEKEFERENFEEYVIPEVIEEGHPESPTSVFIHLFKQINNSSEKVSIYYYTYLLRRINSIA